MTMTSYYLSDEAIEQRRIALANRIRTDMIVIGNGGTFPPESDYWKLPMREQQFINTTR